MKYFLIAFYAATIFHFVLNHILEFIDYRARVKNGDSVPEELEGFVDSDQIKKTVAYENAKYFYWLPLSVCMLSLNLGLVYFGYYSSIFNWLQKVVPNVYGNSILFLILAGLPSAVVEIPFDLYHTFGIEKKFGFNTMTFGTWLLDNIKGLILNAIIMLPLLCLVILIFQKMWQWWWIMVAAVLIIFSLGLSYIYPKFISPIFNKFTPLENQDLLAKLTALLERTGFKASGIYQMDASKRSKHSNAYFTGFGKNKQIVLYDTLLQQLDDEEICAVLAHELGHYKKKHIIKRMLISIFLEFIGAFVLSFILNRPALYENFGFAVNPELLKNYAIAGVFLISIVVEGFSDITGLISNTSSRRDEFQADSFSAQLIGSGKPLASSLIKLNKENLSEFTPPKIYSIFKYNHPPLLERIRNILK